MQILECVANVSEGRDREVVQACAEAVEQAGLPLLDLHVDRDHNRSVFTFAGLPDRVAAAAHALAATAVSRISLQAHVGVHPRIGAIDVIPFVPITGVTMDEAVAVARAFGAELSARHQLPVFLYEAAAFAAERSRLEVIRRGGLPALAARMATAPAWRPDFGPTAPHPTAGAVAVGARGPLIAFNINLASDRLDIAQAVAAGVRERSGGLPAVKALGLPLGDRGIVQVSMNLTDYRRTSMRTVYDRVVEAAKSRGVDVLESEIVGLVPADAITAADAAHMRVRDFDRSKVLEERLSLLRSGGSS